MTSFTLSIVIPTYNRAPQLEPLLEDLNTVLAQHGSAVQVVICDNKSTDRTPEVIASFGDKWPGQIKQVIRKANIGMEGNIACAMMEGDGTYVWMLSDHQRLCVPAIHRTIDQLKVLDFDVGHAKILQWETVLDTANTEVQCRTLSPRKRGEMLFALSNLSTLIFRRELGHAAAGTIFRACVWGFPHLGILSQFKDATRIVEFENMSALPEASHATTLVHGYDKIFIRYRSSIDCITQLGREADVSFDVNGFFTPPYKTSFRGDMLNFLMQPDMSRSAAARKLVPVTLANPWSLKLVSSFALLCILLMPAALRLSFATTTRNMLVQLRRKQKARHA